MRTMDRPILFKCPNTGMNVQHWLAETSKAAPDLHVSVTCPACAKVHFIQSSTGKLLGERQR